MSSPPTPRPEGDIDTPVPPDAIAPNVSLSPSTPTPAPDGTLPPEARELLRELQIASNVPTAESDALSDTRFLAPLPALGATVPGYELLEELGRGGMGVVYKARQLALNRIVALKMIGTTDHVCPGEVARFLAEAEAVAAVTHPNVVEVYDSGSVASAGGRRPYYAMEYVAGGSLADQLRERGPLTPRDAARLLAAVARGIHAAHEAGIVHRDLKPANILLTNSERGTRNADWKTEGRQPDSSLHSEFRTPHSEFHQPKVTDFGLAKRSSSNLTHTKAVMGTPAYMAPEQASGKAKFVGPPADVWAIGVILYECLTRHQPFTADDAWGLAQKVLLDDPPSLRLLARGLPRDLELICLKCLAKEPQDRYATAAELADDLDAFLDGRPVAARPIPLVVRASRWVGRHPAPAGLIAVVAAILFVVPPLVIWNQARLDRSHAEATDAERRKVEAEQKEAVALDAQQKAEQLTAAERQLLEKARQERFQAEQLAAARERFALDSVIARRGIDRPPGWTWENRTDLARAATLAIDPAGRLGLRSAAAALLIAPDFRSVEPVGGGLTGAAVAASPDGSLVAVGEFKAWGAFDLIPNRIHLIDPATGKTVRTRTFPAKTVEKGRDWVQGGVRSLAFSPDSRRLFVGTRASFVHQFDLDDPKAGGPARSWMGSGQSVEQLAVSPDGRLVYGACPRGPLLIFDTKTGERREAKAAPAAVQAFAIDSRNGDLIVASGPQLHRLDSHAARSLGTAAVPLPASPVRLVFVPGAPVLLAAMSDQVAVIDPTTLRVTDQLADPDLGEAAHEEGITELAVHPSGAYLATFAGSDDRLLKVWELASGRLVGTVAVPGTQRVALGWSRDGRFLFATASYRTLRFEFAAPTAGRTVLHFPHTVPVAGFAPDGGRVVALGAAPADSPWSLLGGPAAGGSVDVVPFTGGNGLGRPGVAAVAGNGHIAVTRPGPGVLVFAPGKTEPVMNLSPQVAQSPRYAPDGASIWAIVNEVRVEAWDATTGRSLGVWDNSGARRISGLAELESLAVGRTGAVVGGRDGNVRLLSSRVQWQTQFMKSSDPVMAVAMSPDETLAVAGGRSGVLRVIRLREPVELPEFAGHPGGVVAIAFRPDGALLATGGKDRAVRLWRRVGERFELILAVADLPTSVAGLEFSPSGNELLVLLAHERAVRLWNLDRLHSQLDALKLGW